MVSTVIDILNARLELTGFFHSLYCLAEKKREKREEGDHVYPAQYVGGGDLQMIEFDSAGFAYFRKDGEITQSIVENDFGQSQWYEVTIPLRLVAMVNRSAINGDDAFSPDALARQLASSLTFKNGDLRTALTAAKTQVNAANWITDPEQIWSDETEGTGAIEPDYSRAFIAMSVTVSVTADEKCIQNLCEADTDILHIFDFCKAATVARLTPAQVACLEAAICEVPPTLCEQLAEVEPADVVADVFDCLTEAAQDELLQSQCPVIPPCDPLTVTFDGEVIATIASPCGETVALDCATLTTSAFVENGGAVTGTYAPDGIVNGKTKYTKDVSNYLFYNGTRWELEKTGANVLANVGNEDAPWLATWAAVLVTQANIGEFCANCATGTVEIRNSDGDLIDTVTVASGAIEPYVIPNVSWTQSDGSPQSTPYGDAIVCDMAAGGSLSVAVSDNSPDVGDTITITATPTGFTPTNHLFFTYDGATIEEIVEQASGVYNWLVDRVGTYDIYVLATDGTTNAYGTVEVVATSNFLLDQIASVPELAFALRRLSTAYSGDAALVRRSSDNATVGIGFIGEDLDTAALIAHVGLGDGFTTILYNQAGVANAVQATAGSQPAMVISGTVQMLNGKPTILFDSSSKILTFSPTVSSHAFTVARTNNIAAGGGQYVAGGNNQGYGMAGTLVTGAFIFNSPTLLQTTVKNTTAHQISYRCGAGGAARIRVDGATEVTGSINPLTIGGLGSRTSVGDNLSGSVSEFISFSSNIPDAEELVIEANEKLYWGTP
jgi:hypothetical protein